MKRWRASNRKRYGYQQATHDESCCKAHRAEHRNCRQIQVFALTTRAGRAIVQYLQKGARSMETPSISPEIICAEALHHWIYGKSAARRRGREAGSQALRISVSSVAMTGQKSTDRSARQNYPNAPVPIAFPPLFFTTRERSQLAMALIIM